MFSEFERDGDKIEFEDLLFVEYSSISESRIRAEKVFHYTNASGLIGITNNYGKLKLRFSNLESLNDTSEGKEIYIVFDRVLKEMKENNEISNDFYNLLDKTTFFINNSYTGSNKINPSAKNSVYVCCFSEKEDSLDMWRYYSKGEPGYSLCFITTDLLDDINNEPYNSNIRVFSFNVIYDLSKQKEIIHKRIESIYSYYKNYNNDNKSISINNKIIDFFKDYLSINRFLFKNECFNSEQEFRIVLIIPKNKDINELERKYETSNFGIRDYLEFEFKKECLVGIRISPFQSEAELQKKILEEYLASKEYKNYEVRTSNLPVRY